MAFAGFSSFNGRGIAQRTNRTIIFKRSYLKNMEESITIGYDTNCTVKYQHSDINRTVCLLELLKRYPHILHGFLEDLQHPILSDENQIIDLEHEYQVGTILWLKYPSKDCSNDRLVRVQSLVPSTRIYKWLKPCHPSYLVRHVQHQEQRLAGNNWEETRVLSNGIRLIRGGEGHVAPSDVLLVWQPSGCIKMDYLECQNWILRQKLSILTNHCRDGAEEYFVAVQTCIGRMLYRTAGTSRGKKRKQHLFMPKEFFIKEFCGKLQSVMDEIPLHNQTDWILNPSRTSQTIVFNMNQLDLLYGRNACVRNYVNGNRSSFTVQCISLELTYFLRSESSKNFRATGLIRKEFV
eukprot:21069_1